MTNKDFIDFVEKKMNALLYPPYEGSYICSYCGEDVYPQLHSLKAIGSFQFCERCYHRLVVLGQE